MTEFKTNDLQLSGQGFISTAEKLHENIKLLTSKTQFHEVVIPDGEETRRVGWLVPNRFEIHADFTVHTKEGARGESTMDEVHSALVLDFDGLLGDLIPDQLISLDTADAQEILDKMFGEEEKMKGKFNFDDISEEKGMFIVSPRASFVFVQTIKNSIRISDGGIYVLNRDENGENLIMIDEDHGVNIVGDKNVHVGPDGIYFNGEKFDIAGIMRQVGKAIESSLGALRLGPLFAGLGALGNFGKDFGSDFGEGFGANFGADFGANFGAEISRKINKKLNKKLKKLNNLKINLDLSDLDDMTDHFDDAVDEFEDAMEDAFEEEFEEDFDDAYDVDVDF